MNRCFFTLTERLLPRALVAALLASTLNSIPALAQSVSRQFPAQSQRAQMQVLVPPNIVLDDKPERLAPGARILGPNNLLQLSASLVGQSLPVNYLREHGGLISRVWILNPQEASQSASAAAPRTNIIFESTASQVKPDDGQTPFKQLPKYPLR